MTNSNDRNIFKQRNYFHLTSNLLVEYFILPFYYIYSTFKLTLRIILSNSNDQNIFKQRNYFYLTSFLLAEYFILRFYYIYLTSKLTLRIVLANSNDRNIFKQRNYFYLTSNLLVEYFILLFYYIYLTLRIVLANSNDRDRRIFFLIAHCCINTVQCQSRDENTRMRRAADKNLYGTTPLASSMEFHITWFAKHKEKTFQKAENYSSSTNRGELPRMLLRCVSFNASRCPPKRPESRRNSAFPDRGRMPLSLATRRVHSFPRLFPWTRPRKQSAWKQSPGQSHALHSNQVGRLSERLWRTNRPTLFLSSCSVELGREREREREREKATLQISWLISFGIQFPEICSWVPLDSICCLYVCEYKKYFTRVKGSSLLSGYPHVFSYFWRSDKKIFVMKVNRHSILYKFRNKEFQQKFCSRRNSRLRLGLG